jgi:hypothetical protein
MTDEAPSRHYDYRADPILGAALAYWNSKRGNRSMPARRDIDPVEVPALLPNLQLIELVGSRYRYRLIGTELVYANGRDYTGQYADELFEGARAKHIIEVYDLARDGRQPVFLRSRYVTGSDVNLVANRIYLPLSKDGRDVNMILGALTFESETSISGAWGNSARLDASYVEVIGAP